MSIKHYAKKDKVDALKSKWGPSKKIINKIKTKYTLLLF